MVSPPVQKNISIHAPRERSDQARCLRVIGHIPFQSTLLVRGATGYRLTTAITFTFQSTLLVRGATQQKAIREQMVEISIHAPRERSDITAQ